MMLFGEKYGDDVRVIDIGSSRGTLWWYTRAAYGRYRGVQHCFGRWRGGWRAADEAVTGDNALSYMQGMETTLGGVAGALKVLPNEVPAKVNSLLEQMRRLERELASLKSKLAASQGMIWPTVRPM